MSHKSQSSQFMHPNLCQKGISGLLHLEKIANFRLIKAALEDNIRYSKC